MRVAVIGAGVVGACVSYRLAQAGVDVVTLDMGLPASGTSSQSFAWTNAFNKTPRAYHDLNRLGMREHAALADELGGRWLHRDGNFYVATDAGTAAALQETRDRLAGWGYPIETLSARAAVDLEPDLNLDAAELIVHTPEEGWAEVTPLIGACLGAAARRHGARLLVGTEVTGVETVGGRLIAVTCTGPDGESRVEADRFVLCAGPWTDSVAARLGLSAPIDRRPGILVYTAPIPATLRHLCHAPNVHFRADGGGRVLIGTDIYAERLERQGEAARVAETLLREAAAYFPMLGRARVEATRFGVRPIPPDGLPMVGPLAGADNAYVVVSHSGVTLGPAYGRLVAAELTGTPQPALDPFRPDRFAVAAGA